MTHSASTISLPDQQPREGISEINSKKCEHILITHMCATDLAQRLRRLPAGFYIAVECDGIVTETSNKTVSIDKDIAEWDEDVILPSSRSSVISFEVYASFEHGPKFGSGELLGRFEMSVGEILHRSEGPQAIKFLGSRSEPLSSCLSLEITAERRDCNGSECQTKSEPAKAAGKSEAEELTDEGHHALLNYRQDQDQAYLDKAIRCFQRVHDSCSIDHPNRSTALFNLASAMFIHCRANDHYLSLDIPIAFYRDALHLRTPGHPDHIATVLELGIALLARFQRRGKGYEADKMEAMGLLGKVVELAPADSHTRQAGWFTLDMAKVFTSSQASDSESSDDTDSTDVIDKTRARVRASSHWDPRHPALLAQLGTLLRRRFEEDGDLVDVHEAIFMLDKAAQLVPDDHAERPGFLYELGMLSESRFEQLEDMVDLDRSILMLAEALRLTPDNNPDKPRQLDNVGRSVLFRFGVFGDVADITKSISMFEEAVRLTPDGHPDKPGWYSNLGDSLCRRFERLGDVADITKSISTIEEAVRLTPDGHADKPYQLNNLGMSLSRRFQRLSDVADITKSVSTFEEACRLTLDSHPDKPRWLNNLGISLFLRFQCLREVADITKSILMFEEALRLTPDSHPNRPSQLNSLGSSLFHRFERFGDVADITKSISMKEEAVRLTPDGHPGKRSRLHNLGNSLYRRYECLGDVADMAKSVSMFEEAVRLIPENHPDRPTLLGDLGSSLLRRFERLGDIADIIKSVSIMEEAVQLTPDGHPDKPRWLNNLGNALFCRFEHLNDVADLTKSVSIREEAVHLTPDGHPDKPSRLNNLAISVSRRFERFRNIADITQSISMKAEAVRLTPDGHPDKPIWLNNLGNSLCRRFERLGDIADLTKSVSTFEQAVCLTADGHPEKPRRLTNLGYSLFHRFECLGDVTDITKSIEAEEEAVRLTPDGHPDKPTRLRTLGISFRSRFDQFRDSSDLFIATSLFSSAAQSSIGSTYIRFQAVLSWISSAEVEGNSQSLLDAYSTALGLLPQMAWMGLPLTERHRILGDAANVTRGGVAAALNAGRPEMAVEWLEQGRSIVWTQFLQLRTPADLLRVTHPALAEEFERTSKELEGASSRDQVPSDESFGQKHWSEEEMVEKHHTLTVRREKLLAEIRSLPGSSFDRFLLPRTIDQLAALANSGPVVYLNASKSRCDALIVMTGLGNVVHVPLLGVTHAHVRRMHRLLLDHNCATVPIGDIVLLSLSSSKRDVMAQMPVQGIYDREGGLKIMEVP